MSGLRECNTAEEVLENYRQVRARTAAWKAPSKPVKPAKPVVVPKPAPIVALPPILPPKAEELLPNKGPNVFRIRGEVCRYYSIELDLLCGPRRSKRIMRPRQVTYYLAHELTTASLSYIARLIGNRDHSTILHGVNQIAKRLLMDKDLAQEVAEIEMLIKGNGHGNA